MLPLLAMLGYKRNMIHLWGNKIEQTVKWICAVEWTKQKQNGSLVKPMLIQLTSWNASTHIQCQLSGLKMSLIFLRSDIQEGHEICCLLWVIMRLQSGTYSGPGLATGSMSILLSQTQTTGLTLTTHTHTHPAHILYTHMQARLSQALTAGQCLKEGGRKSLQSEWANELTHWCYLFSLGVSVRLNVLCSAMKRNRGKANE